jgi:hypothetical protein
MLSTVLLDLSVSMTVEVWEEMRTTGIDWVIPEIDGS